MCWKRAVTILIYRRGETSDPANFRPITLQPVSCKIFTTILKSRVYRFLSDNDFIDKKIQKAGMLILVLVLKDSLRTFFKSLSLSWSLGVRSLSLSLSLGVRVQEVLVLVLVLEGQVLVLILVLVV